MRTLLTVLLTLLAGHAFLTAATPAGTDRDPGQELVRELDRALAAPGWDRDRWSVLVVSLDGGDTLYAHEPETSLAPASNLKLFTTAAALFYLRPDYRYSTFLTATGPLRSGVLEGDLYVYGTGDPTLSARFFESKTAVWEALADSLSAAGVREIRGDLVGDASYFEGPGVGRGWERNYVTHTYAAPASALSYNDNVVTMRLTPGAEAGARPGLQLIPGGVVEIHNQATTVTSGRSWIEVDRTGYDSPIVLRGEIRKGASAVWRAVPVVDPAHYAVTVLEEVLEERGIQVRGRIRSVHSGSESPITGQKVFAPALGEDEVIQVLAVHRSPPLQEILKVINRRSHNLYAESVLRSVGRVATGHGSVEGGRAAVATLLEEVGPSGAAVEMDDGSGLSSLDRASARSIVELLGYMARSPFSDEYFETLPEAATSRGLRRMHRTPAAGNLRAKTGTIDRVSALSGYVRAQNGELLAFSILSNNVPSTWKAKRVEDRIGSRLAAFDRPVPARVAGGGPDTLAPALSTGRADSVLAAQAAAPDSAEASRDGAAETAPEPTTYVVKRGDTLEAIAKENGVSVGALREANPGVDPRRLIPGRSLKIPGI
jgi:D-alanyl-D-alanine carboxypeptidase/D-alanyl-D-alanine-endopeptidase (penicillin-binding protein 4)